MARNTTSKTYYEKFAADSGYLSDLVETARKNDEVAAAMLSSSTSGRSTELILSTFEDTVWDVPRKGAKLTRASKACNDIVLQIKAPTRFPIIPLNITLARVRAEVKAHHDQKGRAGSSFVEKLSPTPQSRSPARVANSSQARTNSGQQMKIKDPSYVKQDQGQEKIQNRDQDYAVVNRSDETAEALPKEQLYFTDTIFEHKNLAQTKVQPSEPAVVDGYGRTRAASKRISGGILEAAVRKESALGNSRKRRSDQAEESSAK